MHMKKDEKKDRKERPTRNEDGRIRPIKPIVRRNVRKILYFKHYCLRSLLPSSDVVLRDRLDLIIVGVICDWIALFILKHLWQMDLDLGNTILISTGRLRYFNFR